MPAMRYTQRKGAQDVRQTDNSERGWAIGRQAQDGREYNMMESESRYVVEVKAKNGQESGRYAVISYTRDSAEAAAKYTFFHEFGVPFDECEATTIAQAPVVEE